MASEWRDNTGRVLGQGSQLVYTAERVVMETLSAQVGESQSRVSFTVSTPDAQIQPHVKVLGDELAETVLAFDLAQGLLELKADPRLPTLQLKDVVLGAGLRVRPVQILALSKQGDRLQAQVQLALPRQVIKQGVISEWQAVQLGPNGEIQRLPAQGRAGECAHPIRRSLTLPLGGIPSYTDTIVIPSPFPGLKQLESTLTLQLDAQAVAEAGFCPVFEPPRIEFQEEGNLFSGIRRLEMGAGLRDIEASTYLELNGLAEWGLRQRFPDPPLTLIPVPAFFVGQIGPVSVWVGFDVLGSIPVEAGAELSVSGAKLGVAYRGGRFIQRIRYADSSGWDNTPEFEAGQFNRILEGQVDLSGFLKVGVNPEIEAEI